MKFRRRSFCLLIFFLPIFLAKTLLSSTVWPERSPFRSLFHEWYIWLTLGETIGLLFQEPTFRLPFFPCLLSSNVPGVRRRQRRWGRSASLGIWSKLVSSTAAVVSEQHRRDGWWAAPPQWLVSSTAAMVGEQHRRNGWWAAPPQWLVSSTAAVVSEQHRRDGWWAAPPQWLVSSTAAMVSEQFSVAMVGVTISWILRVCAYVFICLDHLQ